MKCFKGMKFLTGLLSMMLIIGFGATIAMADVTNTVSYQCNLGSSIEQGASSVNMTFYFYSDENKSVTPWQEEHTNVTVHNGIVSVILGKLTPITESVVDSSKYIGVSVNGVHLDPPAELTSSMYAIRAQYAEALAPGIPLASVDPSNLAPNQLGGDVLENGTVTSQKISTTIKKVDNADNNPIIYELTDDDQGLVLVEGNTTITLPTPVNGVKYTFKKTDNGSRGCEGCSINGSKRVTIQCKEDAPNCIDNRTDEIYLDFKHSFVSLVSDGESWFIVESNPPQDIFPPIPGDNGTTSAPLSITSETEEVSITWTAATECALPGCKSGCEETLEYMLYDTSDEKLTSLDKVDDFGKKCFASWKKAIDSATCAVDNSYSGTFKGTVVVRDGFGNRAAYCPPGDNRAPEVTSANFWTSPEANRVNVLWNIPNDDFKNEGYEFFTPKEDLMYSIYFTEEVNDNCLQNLDDLDPDDMNTYCNGHVTAANLDEKAIGVWKPSEFDEDDFTKIHFMSDENATQCTVDVVGLDSGKKYSFTIVVEDSNENRSQYNIVETETD